MIESSSNPLLETPYWALGAFRESFSVWCICPDSSYIPLVFDYLQVFLVSVCTEVCYKQYEIGSVPSEVFCCSWKRHKHGANGRGEGKFGILDLFSIFLLLFFNILSIVFHLYEFPVEPSAPLMWLCACVSPVRAVFTSHSLAVL